MAGEDHDSKLTFTAEEINVSQTFDVMQQKMAGALSTAEKLATALVKVAEAEAKIDNRRKTVAASGSVTYTTAGGGTITADAQAMGTASSAATALSKTMGNVVEAATMAEMGLGKFDKEVQKKPKDLDAASNSANNLFGKLKNFAVGILEYKALQLLTDTLGNLQQAFENTITAAAEMERYKQTFAGLFDQFGVGKGQQHLEELKAFSRTTSFDLKDSISLAQRFTATGMAWGQVIPTMNAASNALARMGGTSKDFAGMSKALSDVQTAGKLTGQEMLQFRNAGVDAMEILRIATGKTGAELTKMLDEGRISSDLFFAALRNDSLAWGNFAQTQAQDYIGINENIADVRYQLDATFGEASMKARVTASKELLDLLSSPESVRSAKLWGEASSIFADAGTAMASTWQTALNDAARFADVIGEAFQGHFFANRGEYDAWVKSITETQTVAIKQVKENLDQYLTVGDTYTQQLQKQIDLIDAMNQKLSDQRQIRDAINSAQTAKEDYERTLALSFDVLSSQGIAAYQSVNDKYRRMKSTAQNAEDVQATIDGRMLKEQLQKDIKAGPPAGWSSYNSLNNIDPFYGIANQYHGTAYGVQPGGQGGQGWKMPVVLGVVEADSWLKHRMSSDPGVVQLVNEHVARSMGSH